MSRPRFVVLLPLALVWACGGGVSSDSTTPAAARPGVSVAEERLKLYVFDCGHMRVDSLEGFGIDDAETPVRELITPCYVIEHPGGRMLWDGGLPSALAAAEGWQDGARLDRTLASQLATLDLGFDLTSLDYVAFSHTHPDHIGVANEVQGATWLVQQAEYDAMFVNPGPSLATPPELYEGLREVDRILLQGEHDVFGDARVRILPAPGHTPGSQVLFLDLVELGPLVLSGDLYHFRLSREQRRVPVFNFDRELTLQSIEQVESFVRETGATLWIQHDLALFETLDTAPSYYE